MMSEDKYEVGYKKPPKATQFKPGQSGNRKGRPKKSDDLSSAINRALNRSVKVMENGVEKKISMLDAVARALIAKTLKGDTRAAKLLFDNDKPPPVEVQFDVDSDDVDALDRFKDRLKGEGANEH